jgi:Mg2+ and Co2+ transporter CorA
MYRIIASEWVVVNTCFQRDLNTIELCLEHEEDPSLERLHRLLKALYKIRRRMTLYEVLIKEQREACRQHGRRHWNRPTSTGTSALADVQKTLETDFAFVADQVTKNQERVAKNISLLMTLISVAESRIGIANGKRVEALTLAAIFLVPFSLVSSVMNINGDLGPGGARQYVFWVISVPFSALLGLGYMYYSRSLAS